MTVEEIKSLTLEETEQRLADIKGKLVIRSDELLDLISLERRRDRLVGPADPRHRSMLEYEPEHNCISLYWSYEYNIDLARIETPQDALSIVAHVAEKGWKNMTPQRIALFIDEVMRIKGWKKFEKRMRRKNEAPPPFIDSAAEREKMTPQLRYKIIKRDGYRCRACGFGVQEGARLQVDHIDPVSKGGKTEEDNLQTLCAACNLGKSNS